MATRPKPAKKTKRYAGELGPGPQIMNHAQLKKAPKTKQKTVQFTTRILEEK